MVLKAVEMITGKAVKGTTKKAPEEGPEVDGAPGSEVFLDDAVGKHQQPLLALAKVGKGVS